MSLLTDIGDDDFVPFLHSLGVETYKKSFEWILNEPAFAGVLKWLYNNLDHNNALTAREECRYIEIERKNLIISPDDLKNTIESIKDDYPGISLPGDQESKEDVKKEIRMMKEKLHLLEKHEVTVKDMIKQNEQIRESLILEVTKLSGAHQQCLDEESLAADECVSLAQELENITDDVIKVIAENLDVYSSCKSDKDTARRFLTFSPLDTYTQTQSMFRSHYDLYVSRNLMNRRNVITDEDLRTALIEAKNVEERLSTALYSYMESSAELSGEQAKLALVANYNNVHPSQITTYLLEAQTALELLEQEENILEQQMQNAIEDMVKSRTSLAVNTAAAAALEVRQQISDSLAHLVDIWQQALSLDKLLYYSLRHELRTLEEFLQFAVQLKQYITSENMAICSRVESMKEITSEHEICHNKMQKSNILLETLFGMFESQTNDVSILVKLYNDLMNKIKELKRNVDDCFLKKQAVVDEIKTSSSPLVLYVFSGCTRLPTTSDRSVAALTHTLTHRVHSVDKRVLEATGKFTAVKNGDKQNLRKLWQWFLTDPAKLQNVLKQYRNY